MIRYLNVHYTRCQQKHLALTRPGGHWPLDCTMWVAGEPAALDQLTDMARVYLRDVKRPADDPQRIWSADEAQALLLHLCHAVLDSSLYDGAWCRALLAEVA